MRPVNRNLAALVVAIFLAASAFAQSNVESITSTPTASEAIIKAVADHALKFTASGNTIHLWAAKSVSGDSNGTDGALYPDLPRGAFAGVIQFASEAADFRGQKIPAGTYTLRYAVLPSDGNHLGVAPSPDFFLLVPVANDSNPDVPIAYPRLIKSSARAAGTNHPAAFSLASASKKSQSVNADEKGHLAVTFDLKVNGKTLPIAMIVVGVAEQ